jgi:hypothetical protein
MAEKGGQGCVPTDELSRGEAMALGLENVMVVNGAKLTDCTVHRTYEVGMGQGTSADFEWPREEIIEAFVAADVRVRSFTHINAVFPDKPTDQPRREASSLRPGNATGKSGHTLLGQQMLKQDV